MSRSSEVSWSGLCARAGAGLAMLMLSVWIAPGALAAASPWSGIGRAATPAEIQAWDIDVRADFKGLPAGSGSVARGQEIWEDKCASCHGIFGESNEVFSPVIGGTTAQDVLTGRVANLKRTDYPQRTTMMKVSQVSTLWDYISRAMPWNAPKSLAADEVYAVLAYMLHLADVLPADHVLSDRNIAQAQQRLPNRHGKVTYQGLWESAGKPDVQGDACRHRCATVVERATSLPEFARNAHGNLAEQNRVVGPFRGADTTRPPARDPLRLATAAGTQAATAQVQVARGAAARAPADLARDAACLACHSVARKLVGPSFRDIAQRYQNDPKAEQRLATTVRNGGQGNWGSVPMPASTMLKDDELLSVIRWVLGSAR